MKKPLYAISISLLSFSLVSCTFFKDRSEESDESIRREYYPDGKVHKEIVMRNGKETGSFKEYFKSGDLFQEVTFIKNKREGIAKKFYEGGVLYEEIPYKDGMKHGTLKRYRRSGELMSEVPYYDGHLCKGLKEYTIDGKVKVRYPTIQFKEIDNILLNGNFTLEISLSDGTKGNVEYFEGSLTKDGYIASDASPVWEIKNGIGKMKFNIQRGTFIMKEMKIIAKLKTVQGNYYITEGTHNLALERRF
jgi:hypothetical protein